MRFNILACLAAAILLASACSPAVGSPEWCAKVIKEGLAKVAEMPADQQQAAGKCAADELAKRLSSR
jgi:hypothetical protein